MNSCVIREGTSSDLSVLFELLNQAVIDQGRETEFTNSQTNFEQHFKDGLFEALVAESFDPIEQRTDVIGCALFSVSFVYAQGRVVAIDCLYAKPTSKNSTTIQALLQRIKEVAVSKGIDVMSCMVKRSSTSYKQALEAEGGINVTITPPFSLDMWMMPNISEASTRKNEDWGGDYRIRKGSEKDVDEIYGLLQRLAEYEQLDDQWKLTKEEFKHAGTASPRMYSSLVLEHLQLSADQSAGQTITTNNVGCILYSDMYSSLTGRTFYLQGLYLHPHLRGKGLGKDLVQATQRVCKELGGDGFLAMIINNNTASQSLFRSLGAVNFTESEHEIETFGFWL